MSQSPEVALSTGVQIPIKVYSHRKAVPGTYFDSRVFFGKFIDVKERLFAGFRGKESIMDT